MLNSTNKVSLFSFILLTIVSILTIVWCWYIYAIDVNVLGGDHYQMILLFEDIVAGNKHYSELWNPKGGHRLIGYQLIFFANLYLFGYLAVWESVVAILIFSGLAFYFIKIFSSSISPKFSYSVIFAIFFALMLFNGQTLRISVYSLIALRLADFAGFILIFLCAMKIIMEADKNNITIWGLFVFLIACCYLLFGRGWGVAASYSLIAILVFFNLSNRTKDSVTLIRSAIILVLVFISLAIYFNGLKGSPKSAETDFLALGWFYLVKLGSANLSAFSSTLGRNMQLSVAFSVIYLIATSLICLFFLIKKRIEKTELMAVYLILFSLASTGLVALSRYDVSPFFPRHNFELSIGLLGMFYLVFKGLFSLERNKINTVVIFVTVLLIIFLGLRLMKVTGQYDSIKRYHSTVEERIDNYLNGSKEFDSFREVKCPLSPEKCNKSFRILEEYRAN